MQADEIFSDAELVARLVAGAAPGWAGLPVRRVASDGTDNAIYRLGGELAVRLPRRLEAVALLEKEAAWLARFGPLPLEVPRPRCLIPPGEGFAHPALVLDWVPGAPAPLDRIADPVAAAETLAAFLAALQAQPVAGAPKAGPGNHMRGAPLERLEEKTLAAIAVLADEIDAPAARALWQEARQAPLHRGPPVWLHGDLKAGNLLARGGRLCGAIDWGLAAVGDPAADYASAWAWGAPEARDAIRTATEAGEAAWARAQGWALYGAVIALSYYRGGRNPALSATSRATLAALGLR